MNIRTAHSSFLFLILPIATSAFSSISAPPPSYGSLPTDTNEVAPTTLEVTTETAPWRVTLDIGREALSRMPFDWARSGCRMPLVVGLDFEQVNAKDNQLYTRSDTVSFTGPDGAVVKPIVPGDWNLSNDQQELSFSLMFPETMARRDVVIEGGTTVELTGRVYTQAELDQLNEEYYKARETTWQLGGALNDMANRQGAAKKWNEETKRWEKRYPNENPLAVAQKQLTYWGAKLRQNQKLNQRPDPNTLSDRGSFPGIDKGLYVARGGVVRQGKNGPVMGTWYAQPITKTPASYRN